MMKYYLYICLFIEVIAFTSCSKKYEHSITADVSGINDTSVIIYVEDISSPNIGKRTMDTIKAEGGRIIFDVKYPLNHLVIIPKKNSSKSGGIPYDSPFSMDFVLSSTDKIYVKGKLSEEELKYDFQGEEGEKINTKLVKLRDSYLPNMKAYRALRIKLDSIYKRGSAIPIYTMQRKMIQERRAIQNYQIAYVTSHLKDQTSGFLLLRQSRRVFLENYNKLSNEVKNGLFKKPLDKIYLEFNAQEKVVKLERQIREGKPAPTFILETPDGKKKSLSQIKSKYILLDFWETWCTPAIEAFPKLKKYQKKYKGKLKIVSIICDDKKDDWNRIIKENKLSWINLKNIQGGEHGVKQLYAISGYPTRILLDRDKKILMKFVGESSSFYEKLDKILKQKSSL